MTTSHDTSVPRRFAHPEADVVWAAIEALSEPQKHEVLRELASVVAIDEASPRTAAQKVRKGVAALRQAFDLLGGSPSIQKYRQLCETLPELSLPADSSIRSWLGGGWNECLSRALLPTISDGDFSEISQGSAYTREELIRAVRECAEDLGRPPFWSDYRTWAKKANDEGRPGRRPLSVRPFDRLDGFLKVCVDAGVIERGQAARDMLNRVIPAAHAYTKEECNAALQEVTRHLKLGRSPRTKEYSIGRREILDAAATNGELRTLPGYLTITHHATDRTWDSALADAGLEPLGGKATASNRHARRPSYTDEELCEALRRGWAAVGEPFTAESYDAWRKQEIARIVSEGGRPHIPSPCSIGQRLGGWPNACLRAIPGYTIDERRVRPTISADGRLVRASKRGGTK